MCIKCLRRTHHYCTTCLTLYASTSEYDLGVCDRCFKKQFYEAIFDYLIKNNKQMLVPPKRSYKDEMFDASFIPIKN